MEEAVERARQAEKGKARAPSDLSDQILCLSAVISQFSSTALPHINPSALAPPLVSTPANSPQSVQVPVLPHLQVPLSPEAVPAVPESGASSVPASSVSEFSSSVSSSPAVAEFRAGGPSVPGPPVLVPAAPTVPEPGAPSVSAPVPSFH